MSTSLNQIGRKLTKIFAGGIIFALLLLLPTPNSQLPSVSASGVLYARVGDTVELRPATTGSFDYSWVLKKGEEIIPQESGVGGGVLGTSSRSGSVTASTAGLFRHTFREEGAFSVNVVRTDRESGEIQSTEVEIVVSLQNPDFTPRQAILRTLPALNANQKVFLSGKTAEVIFLAGESRGGASEYHLDADLAVDSDRDGVSDNDIDNAAHPSFFTGQAWGHVYSSEKTSRLAELTVRYPDGEEEKTTVEIIFNQLAGDDRRSRELRAVLETIPAADEKGVIHLSGDEADVSFFAGNSEGDIAEYRIDKNINFDTDSDGDPKNDIDNAATPSFQTGAPWQTDFQKEWSNVIVELLVVGKDRRGSRVQRQIVFDAPIPGSGDVSDNPFQKLIVSRPQIFVGESIDFLLLGVPEGAEISWDFDGDGVPEYEGERQKNTYEYQAAGEFPVIVTVTKAGAEVARFEEKVTVQEPAQGQEVTSAPTASFIFSSKDNVVSFQSTSSADPKLINQELTFSWDFGDQATSDEAEPEHAYEDAKTYTVVLTVTDAAGRSSTTAQNIEVETGTSEDPTAEEPSEEETPAEPEEPAEESGGLGWLWATLFILLLPLLIVGGYLVVRKIQLPDLSFGEIFVTDLEKAKHFLEKLLKKEKPVEPVAPAPAEGAETPEVVTPETVAESPTPPVEEVPEWIKPEEALPAEAPAVPTAEQAAVTPEAPVSELPTPSAEQPGVSPPPAEDIPDWLKTDSAESPEPSAPDAEAVPDWLKSAPDSDATPPASAEETPEWLKPDFNPAENADSATEESVPDESSPPAPESPPETAAPEDSSETPPPSAPPADRQEDLPDWMK